MNSKAIGFYQALCPRQQAFHRETFNDDHPCCAAGMGCLSRSEWWGAERDPRKWRTIGVCLGPASANVTRPAYVDHVFTPGLFKDVYESLSEIGERRPFEHTSKVALHLYVMTLRETADSITYGTGVGDRACFSLAIANSRDFNVQVVADKLIATMCYATDFFVPRVIRILSNDVMKSQTKLRADQLTAGETGGDVVFLYCSGRYIAAEEATRQEWKDFYDDLGPADHTIAYGFPCTALDEKDTPSIWMHAECARARLNDDAVPDHVAFECPTCLGPMQSTTLSVDGKFTDGPWKDKAPHNFAEFGDIAVIGGWQNFDLYRCRLPQNLMSRKTMVVSKDKKFYNCDTKELFNPRKELVMQPAK